MKKPADFNIENLYENLEKERIAHAKWNPTVPIDILKAVYKARNLKPPITWQGIIRALRDSGVDYTYNSLKWNIARAKEENLFDNE
jgi:hypothetical protein